MLRCVKNVMQTCALALGLCALGCSAADGSSIQGASATTGGMLGTGGAGTSASSSVARVA